MDYYYHILVTWAMPLMIFLINLRSYPIRLVLLHPHHLESIWVILQPHQSHQYLHTLNRSSRCCCRHHHHHHQKLHPPMASPNVARVISKFLINTTNTVTINTTTVSTTIPSSDSSWSRSI
ncbi:hypothetical protein CMV_008779 [Castanea mollissima]|uniref:Uncharacterized protein n=1 Tax=Castanea mollissima TaxID=60419 RepID=A0A8J4RM49_9ROSI|nr:hypothetical protein CMV_008779 [Castanea mollissima]